VPLLGGKERSVSERCCQHLPAATVSGGWCRSLLLCLPLLLAVGCGDDGDPAPEPEVITPIALTTEVRALAVDSREVAVVQTSFPESPATILGLFPRLVIARQLHDEFFCTPEVTEEECSFAVRIVAEWESLAATYLASPGSSLHTLVVVLDLLTLDQGALVAPPTIRATDRSFQKGESARYSQHVLQQLKLAASSLLAAVPASTRLVFVVGTGVNRLGAAEFGAFKQLYAEHLQPELVELVEEAGRPPLVTTALDWESFLATLPPPTELEDPEKQAVEQQEIDASGFADLVSGLEGKVAPWAFRTIPSARYETVEAIPDDHLHRLRHLLPAGEPVAFLPAYWRCTKGDDFANAQAFLRKFRTLAGNFRLDFVVWPRFVDLTDQGCGRFATSLGGPRELCYAGLVRSTGNPKPLWNELIKDDAP